MTNGTTRRLTGAYIVMAAGSTALPWALTWLCDICEQWLGPDGRVLWNAAPPVSGGQAQTLLSTCSAACSAEVRASAPDLDLSEWDVAAAIAVLANGRHVADRVVELLKGARLVQMIDPSQSGPLIGEDMH